MPDSGSSHCFACGQPVIGNSAQIVTLDLESRRVDKACHRKVLKAHQFGYSYHGGTLLFATEQLAIDWRFQQVPVEAESSTALPA